MAGEAGRAADRFDYLGNSYTFTLLANAKAVVAAAECALREQTAAVGWSAATHQ